MSEEIQKSDFAALLSYLKYAMTLTLTLLGFIFSAFAFFLWQDRNEMKEDIQEIKADAQEQIALIRDSAYFEIKQIKESAKLQAKREVSKVFANDNTIRGFLQNETRKEVDRISSVLVENKISIALSQLDSDISTGIKISYAASKMKDGNVEGMKELKRLSVEANLKSQKDMASEYLYSICLEFALEYDSGWEEREFEPVYQKLAKEDLISNLKFMISTLDPKKATKFDLRTLMRNLNMLNQFYGKKFTVCDLDAAYRLLESKLSEVQND